MLGAYGRLISSIFIGAAGSLFAAALSQILAQRFANEKTPKRLVIIELLVAAGLAVASMFIGFDISYEVPYLNNLPLADAETRLEDLHLDPVVKPSDTPDIALGLVVWNPAESMAGQLVRPHTRIDLPVSDNGANSIDYPAQNSQVDCTVEPEGFCAFEVDIETSALVRRGDLLLLLWARSPGSGWYYQAPTPAMPTLSQGNAVKMNAQVGSSAYPPKDDEQVDLALTAITHATAPPKPGLAFAEPIGYTLSAVSLTIKVK
jgi:hypothetical protein